MRILIIKISSIGDLIHTFPAIADANSKFPNLIIDWLVDDDFIDIVRLHKNYAHHSNIAKIIAIPLRGLKKLRLKSVLNFSVIDFLTELRAEKYDIVLDAQGLIKSAIFTKFARSSKICGFNYACCKESMASIFYTHKFAVSKELHAITRLRELFAQSLGYGYEPNIINYGLNKEKLSKSQNYSNQILCSNYVVFLYGTTWVTKHWEQSYWDQLAKLLAAQGIKIITMFADLEQQEFSQALVDNNPNVIQLPKLDLLQVATVIANASAAVAVDTGFGHLAASFAIPVVGIYGATAAARSGILSNNSVNLSSRYHCAPCFSRVCLEYQQGRTHIKQPCYLEITPKIVMQELLKLWGYKSFSN